MEGGALGGPQMLSVWRQPPRMSHALGFEDVVELSLSKPISFDYQFVDAAIRDESFLGDSDALSYPSTGLSAVTSPMEFWT
jgi:hypothetical protein